ncbi:hypothetical protein EXIGLDRAFT_829740 [Exidia glandulosa HHB12029]|uniref:Uncharacterized protein n=1 Tax=Exidia glandulosa HHB12029 TaxID=1314781 RepID=A0A165P8U7_EXIGL|nr:hypothetical protein EXIGLDRAFT_829740 [Exidia glandulosa HHB12029]
MACLLTTIPPELRDDIIERVLLYERPAPSDISSEHPNREHAPAEAILNAKKGSASRVRLERSTPTCNAAGLVCASHQLASETRAVANRLKLVYKLDLLLVHETWLWPTWTCLPLPADRIEHMHVTIRLLARPPAQHKVGLLSSYRGPPALMWALYFLLESGLTRGFAFRDQPGRPSRPICVQNLTLDFVERGYKFDPIQIRAFITRDPTARVDHAYDAWVLNQYRPRPLPTAEPMRIHWFARIVRPYIDLVVRDPWNYKWSAVVHQRVGSVVIAICGQTMYTLDVADVLATLRAKHHFTDVLEGFLPMLRAYMVETLALRAKRGLPVPATTRVLDGVGNT